MTAPTPQKISVFTTNELSLDGTELVILDNRAGNTRKSLLSVIATYINSLIVQATTSVTGISMLATAAKINTGTDTTCAIPVDQFVASKRNVKHVVFDLIDPTSYCSAATTVGGDRRLNINGTIIDCGLWHDTAGTTGTEITDIHLAGTTIMTINKIACATGQKSSEDGGATQPTITTSAYTANAILTVDIDTAHSGTAAKGLHVWLDIRES